MSEETLSTVKNLTAELWRLRRRADRAEELLEKRKARFTAVRLRLLQILEAAELERFDGDECSVSVRRKSSVKIPQTLEDKKALFKYLRDKGVYWRYVNINSASLNTFYAAEEALALERGEYEFSLPGILPATSYTELAINKKRK